MLFNEPKLLKFLWHWSGSCTYRVSVLFNEPKLLKSRERAAKAAYNAVSVLFNEPKLLKSSSIEFWELDAREFQCSSTSRNC